MQRTDIIGQLALQEGGRFLAVKRDDAKLRQIRDNGAIRGGGEFRCGLTIMLNGAIHDLRALGLQKILPNIDHGAVQSERDAMKRKSVHADA